MTFVLTPYALIAAAAAVMAGVVAVIAWQRRAAPGGGPLVILMVTLCFWSAGVALEYATVGIPGKLIWAKIEYVGVVTCPVFFLLLAMEYSRQDRWLTRRNIALLFVIPFITLLLAVTNDWHGLIWPGIELVGSPADNLALYGHGLGFWIGSVGYAYLLMLLATVLLIRAAIHLPAIYRRQAIALLLAALAPWLVNIIYVADLSPLPGLELTPLVMIVSGAIFALSILRYQLLDLAPVAREQLIETMADGMVVLDHQDRVVDINPAAQEMLGFSGPIHLGQSVKEIWPECKVSAGATPSGSVELPLTSTRRRYLELSTSPLHDRHGKFSGRLVVIRDITDRKAAQAEIELLNAELEARVAARTQDLLASEERFRQVITSISDHVFALRVNTDGAMTPIYRSPRLSELTGYPTEDLSYAFTNAPAQIVHPEDLAAVDAFYHQQLEDIQATEIEHRLLRADGSILWVRTSLRVHPDGQEKIVFGVTSDITGRKQMEQAQVEMRALAELDKLRTELVGNVSHELRTPLGLIKVASTTLLRQDVTFPPAVQEQILRGVVAETDRLERLVADLLDISRLDQGRFFLQWESANLNQLVTAVVAAAQAKAKIEPVATHRFVLALPEPEVEAVVDKSKIEQVLDNLLENAVRYSPAGGVITVTVRPTGQGCELRVADQGIGISPDDQEHIFDRFYRVRDARVRHVRGAGLGLAICRELVAAHGGTVHVESAHNEGATFIVSLPSTGAPAADVDEKNTSDCPLLADAAWKEKVAS